MYNSRESTASRVLNSNPPSQVPSFPRFSGMTRGDEDRRQQPGYPGLPYSTEGMAANNPGFRQYMDMDGQSEASSQQNSEFTWSQPPNNGGFRDQMRQSIGGSFPRISGFFGMNANEPPQRPTRPHLSQFQTKPGASDQNLPPVPERSFGASSGYPTPFTSNNNAYGGGAAPLSYDPPVKPPTGARRSKDWRAIFTWKIIAILIILFVIVAGGVGGAVSVVNANAANQNQDLAPTFAPTVGDDDDDDDDDYDDDDDEYDDDSDDDYDDDSDDD